MKKIEEIVTKHIVLKFNYSLLEELATNPESEYYEYFTEKEVSELWGISEWLAHKLMNQGEICFNYHGLWLWGRIGSGQSISKDTVFSEIFVH
jgi:hypothetical protein